MVAALRVHVQAGAVERAAEEDDTRRSPRECGNGWPDVRGPGPAGHVQATTRPWYRLIAEATANCIRGAETAVIPAARHMAIVKNPSGTASLVLSFIRRH